MADITDKLWWTNSDFKFRYALLLGLASFFWLTCLGLSVWQPNTSYNSDYSTLLLLELCYSAILIPVGFGALHHSNKTMLEIDTYMFLALGLIAGYGFLAYLFSNSVFAVMNFFACVICVTLYVKGQLLLEKLERLTETDLERGPTTTQSQRAEPIGNYTQIKAGKHRRHRQKKKEQEKRPEVS